MDNNTAQIIGIVETSILPDPIKANYINKLTIEGASKEIVESIKGYLRSLMTVDAKKADVEPPADDPKVSKLLTDYEASTNSLNDRYIATMEDLEERIDKVMNETSSQLEKIQTQIVKDELIT